MAQTTLINGEAVSWAQINVTILGNVISGITAISYEDEQEITNNYGKGNFPVSRGFGKIESKASMTLLAEEVDVLQEAAPDGRLQSIPEFDVLVSYIPVGGSTTIRNHKIRNCRFTNNKREAKQGDTQVEVELELMPSHIEWV